MKSLSSDTKGQALVIGGLSILLLLLIASSLYIQNIEPIKNTDAEVEHQNSFEESMLELHSKTTQSKNTTYQSFNSKIDYTFFGSQFYQNMGYKLSNSSTSENLTFTNTNGNPESITTNGQSLTIERDYMYISDTSYTYQHTYISRTTSNADDYIITPVNVVNDDTIILQNVTVDTITKRQAFNIQITEKSSTKTTKQITDGTIRLETNASVEQFQELESESTVIDVTREGDDIVITLQDEEYTILTKNIHIKSQ